ncbi:hypothetical protein [Microbacterium sp. CJ88]|uniref:hypothetical protein n=1 Tax=Microbacterium sp. CJ88 TaxID=3445672 RepID=UPI003F65C456
MERVIDSETSLIETCPGCGSVDLRAIEPGWFAIELERRTEMHDDDDRSVRVEFGCRDCGLHWT